LLALLLLQGSADAGKRVVMLGIGGAGGADASHQLTRGLAGRFELVSRGRLGQEASKRGGNLGSPTGRTLAARALKVSALIGGSVSRAGGQWVIRVVVHNGASGQPVGSMAFPMRGMRLDAFTARRVVTWVITAVGRTRVGPPVAGEPVAARPPRRRPVRVVVRALPTAAPRPPERTPPPAPAPAPVPGKVDDGFDDGGETDGEGDADDPKGYRAKGRENGGSKRPKPADEGDLEFDSGDGESDDDEEQGSRRRKRTARRDDSDERTTDATAQFRKNKSSPDARPEWEKIIEISVGVMMLSRSFDFHDPVEPVAPSNYSSGLVPALIFGGETYPLAYFVRGPLANLGIVGHYYRVPVLRSQLQGYVEPVETTLHELEIGLRYRWNFMGSIGSPTLKAGLSFGRLGFVIHWDPALYQVPLPNIVYVYLKFATALDVPFFANKTWSVGATGSFDYLYVFSAGDIERTDTSGYGRSNTQGIEIGGGLYASYRGFFLRMTGFYRRIFYAFDNQCYNDSTGCHTAGGALDIYQGATILGGYAF
jgi:hypothetical protein